MSLERLWLAVILVRLHLASGKRGRYNDNASAAHPTRSDNNGTDGRVSEGQNVCGVLRRPALQRREQGSATPRPARIARKDDDWRRDWLDR